MPVNRLRLWQLISPALPIGAYAYSQGMEYAVNANWITDEDEAAEWIEGQLRSVLACLDVPVFARLYRAWGEDDGERLEYWSRFLLASRESSELVAEDRYLGTALARLLIDLGIEQARRWQEHRYSAYATVFTLAASHWRIDLDEAAEGYLWAWGENQVAAAIKLVPLGQTAGQRILSSLIDAIPKAVRHGLTLEEDDIGALAPGLGIASALHETQYTRLFRS